MTTHQSDLLTPNLFIQQIYSISEFRTNCED